VSETAEERAPTGLALFSLGRRQSRVQGRASGPNEWRPARVEEGKGATRTPLTRRGLGGTGRWGDRYPTLSGEERKAGRQEGLALFRTVEPARMGDDDWRRAPRGVASESVPLYFRPYGPLFVLSVSLAQSGFHSVWRGWVLQEVWSMERGAWNMEAACIRHTRRSSKRRDIHVQSDLFVWSHDKPDRRPGGFAALGMIRTRSCFPQTTRTQSNQPHPRFHTRTGPVSSLRKTSSRGTWNFFSVN
jgi:hypothetical protein